MTGGMTYEWNSRNSGKCRAEKETEEEIIQRCISHLDTDYSCRLAKQMEREKTNPVLGFRTAGSRAEKATGDFLYEEMRSIGLTDVQKKNSGWIRGLSSGQFCGLRTAAGKNIPVSLGLIRRILRRMDFKSMS